MPISRDARMDRRRRLLRETSEEETPSNSAPRRPARKAVDAEPEIGGPKRKAGYSQDVRKACGQRLVQLIPVRKRSFAAVIFVSLLVPGLLLLAHYLIHVTGQLQWWRHPLAVALDVGHPRSIAAWLSSQLWLLCLGATILTFQLRRHKLDDYNGEYRLWFWLVLTCLVASIDATTSIAELFALALDGWTQTNLGWSGPAVVDATMTVLIGMLGLRMCTELKAVPMSLVLWLTGLLAWAGSAALARPELKLEMSAPIRYWLISTFWLGGLTVIWLAALTYLRSIYVEAQHRFLLRGRLAQAGVPLGQRIRESIPQMPRFGRGERTAADAASTELGPTGKSGRWAMPGLPKFLKRGPNTTAAGLTDDTQPSNSRRRAKNGLSQTAGDSPATREMAVAEEYSPAVSPKDARPSQPPAGQAPRRGLGNFLKRSGPSVGGDPEKAPIKNNTQASNSASEPKRSRFGGWLRRPKDNDEAEEYRKVTADSKLNQTAESATQAKGRKASETGETSAGPRRGWLPKLSRPKLALPKLRSPKLPKVKQPAANAGKEKSAPGGWRKRLKLPSLSLSALRLQPPEATEDEGGPKTPAQSMRPVDAQRPLPGTNYSPQGGGFDEDGDEDDDAGDGRPLSKAERKRMRRLQQQGNQPPNRRSA